MKSKVRYHPKTLQTFIIQGTNFLKNWLQENCWHCIESWGFWRFVMRRQSVKGDWDNFTSFFLFFRHRLLQEIYCLLQSPQYKENLFIKTIKMHQTPVSPNCTSWLGGMSFDMVLLLSGYSSYSVGEGKPSVSSLSSASYLITCDRIPWSYQSAHNKRANWPAEQVV